MSKRILITGFGPFQDIAENPCTALINSLSTIFKGSVKGHQIEFMHLDTSYHKGLKAFKAKLESYAPDLTLCFGVHGGADGFRLERVARNQANIEKHDWRGYTPILPILEQQGTGQYLSTLPLKPMQDALIKNSIDASITEDAGSYLCNAAFYYLMRHIETTNPYAQGGFIHIPDTDHETLLHGAQCIMEVALK